MGMCDGRVALVTGGSRGIGRATALRLAHEGADVALVARDVDGERLGRSLAATVEEVRGIGVRAIALPGDLASPTFDRASIVEQTEAELGPIDILVNNAAMSVFRNVAEWAPAKVRLMFEVNVLAPWELISAAVPGMIERDRGWIVNISSGVGDPGNPRPGGAAYGGTKAMLDQMTRCLALELEGTKVVANVVSPQGASRTEFVDQLVQSDTLEAGLTEPLEAMAEAVLALATAPPAVRGSGDARPGTARSTRPTGDGPHRDHRDRWLRCHRPRLADHLDGRVLHPPGGSARRLGSELDHRLLGLRSTPSEVAAGCQQADQAPIPGRLRRPHEGLVTRPRGQEGPGGGTTQRVCWSGRVGGGT